MTDPVATVAAETALLVTVPAAEAVVGPHRLRLDGGAADGVPAHLTVLYPFAPPDRVDHGLVARLTAVARSHQAFDFELSEVRWFGEQVVWLHPEPHDRFVALFADAQAAFPEFPLYGGAYADLVPHLTVGADAPVTELRAAAAAITPALPIRAAATELTVLARLAGQRWHPMLQVPLGRG